MNNDKFFKELARVAYCGIVPQDQLDNVLNQPTMDMELIVKAKHFHDSEYMCNCNCPIAKAAKDQFGAEEVSEGVDEIRIDGIEYSHPWYSSEDCANDKLIADNMKPEAVVFVLPLKRQP